MQLSDIRNPNERNKLILAGALGLIAIVFLWWAFFGFGSSSPQPTPRAGAQPTPSPGSRRASSAPVQSVEEFKGSDPGLLQPVVYPDSSIVMPEARRNIFIYYEKPPQPVAQASVPTPTPTPEPPVLLASIAPANVYARTGDFKLEISGDKFTPQMRVLIDNNEMPTRYVNAQQLSASVSAAVIANPGGRQVMVRSADGQFYSNTTTLSVADPPKPNYSYIGIIGTPRYVDIAILLDKGNKDTLNVQRGDLLGGGKFRVTSISEKEVVVVDTNLKVKHSLPMTTQGDRGNPLQRPTPRVESEDDEP